MSSPDGRGSPDITVGDGSGRVWVYAKKCKFRVGESVHLRVTGGGLEGPYLIESVPTRGRYTLVLADGRSAKNGQQVNESDLQKEDGESDLQKEVDESDLPEDYYSDLQRA
ncbi:hypothetical protein B0H63DRAFT_463639 [Podospora didyma]|uniref:Uncharacterized protein n=1 Tax=Podospora didyma TaxID=330526 RepID=A0AAE0NXH0_9PEZI|nr:hypothetical protein B0H63DRAFT_463639 [Podospora didyma]